MKELWKCIEGYCGIYQISSEGRVKSVERFASMSDGRRMFVAERIKIPQLLKMGYNSVTLFKLGKGKTFYIHRLVAAAFIENHEDKEQVNHIDLDKLNNSVDNLEWCTPSENSQHAHDNGAVPKFHLGKTGIKSPNAKYTVFARKGSEVITMTGNIEFKENGFSPSCVNQCLNGKMKQHRGYTFDREWF